MTAELLTRAATLIRERAQAATPGRWEAIEDRHRDFPFPCIDISVWSDEAGRYVTEDVSAVPESQAEWRSNANHIASWHPAVALAVADQLEAAAALASWKDQIGLGVVSAVVDAALEVARAYLGEEA